MAPPRYQHPALAIPDDFPGASRDPYTTFTGPGSHRLARCASATWPG